MRRFDNILRNKPSAECVELAELIIMNLSQIEDQIKDKQAKSAIQSIKRGTYFPESSHVALRMDSIQDDYEIGMVSAMGTTATISRRIIAASHYANIDAISEMIFVSHSQKNVWYQEYHNKEKRAGKRLMATGQTQTLCCLYLEQIKESLRYHIS